MLIAVPRDSTSCCIAAAAGAVEAHTLFFFFFVSGDQCGCGGENCRESQKEAADRWPEFFSDEAGGDGDQTPEENADGVLVPFGFFQRAEIHLNVHCYFTALMRLVGRFSNSPPEKSPPEAHRNDEPDDEETGRGEFRLGLFAVQENHRAPSVHEERGGSGEHRAGFKSRVGYTIGFNGERECGEGDRRRGAEQVRRNSWA